MRHVKYTNSANFHCLEHLSETSMDLYLIHVGKETCSPGHAYGPSGRDEYIIHFVISGKGIFTTHGITYHLKANEMFLIRPDEDIFYQADTEDPWSYFWIGFNGIMTKKLLNSCGFSKKSPVLPIANIETVKSLVSQILDASHLTFSHELKRKAFLLALFSYLIDSHQDLNASSKNKYERNSNTYVVQAIDYIKQHHSLGINVSDIADYIGISRAYLNRTFQKELGISVQRFLVDFRMHKAANLLVSSNSSINEIADAVGYDDALAFSKAFKKKFNFSPKNFREHKDIARHYKEKQLVDHQQDFY